MTINQLFLLFRGYKLNFFYLNDQESLSKLVENRDFYWEAKVSLPSLPSWLKLPNNHLKQLINLFSSFKEEAHIVFRCAHQHPMTKVENMSSGSGFTHSVNNAGFDEILGTK